MDHSTCRTVTYLLSSPGRRDLFGFCWTTRAIGLRFLSHFSMTFNATTDARVGGGNENRKKNQWATSNHVIVLGIYSTLVPRTVSSLNARLCPLGSVQLRPSLWQRDQTSTMPTRALYLAFLTFRTFTSDLSLFFSDSFLFLFFPFFSHAGPKIQFLATLAASISWSYFYFYYFSFLFLCPASKSFPTSRKSNRKSWIDLPCGLSRWMAMTTSRNSLRLMTPSPSASYKVKTLLT